MDSIIQLRIFLRRRPSPYQHVGTEIDPAGPNDRPMLDVHLLEEVWFGPDWLENGTDEQIRNVTFSNCTVGQSHAQTVTFQWDYFFNSN